MSYTYKTQPSDRLVVVWEDPFIAVNPADVDLVYTQGSGRFEYPHAVKINTRSGSESSYELQLKTRGEALDAARLITERINRR